MRGTVPPLPQTRTMSSQVEAPFFPSLDSKHKYILEITAQLKPSQVIKDGPSIPSYACNHHHHSLKLDPCTNLEPLTISKFRALWPSISQATWLIKDQRIKLTDNEKEICCADEHTLWPSIKRRLSLYFTLILVQIWGWDLIITLLSSACFPLSHRMSHSDTGVIHSCCWMSD